MNENLKDSLYFVPVDLWTFTPSAGCEECEKPPFLRCPARRVPEQPARRGSTDSRLSQRRKPVKRVLGIEQTTCGGKVSSSAPPVMELWNQHFSPKGYRCNVEDEFQTLRARLGSRCTGNLGPNRGFEKCSQGLS